MTLRHVAVQARIRARNQLTLPDQVVQAAGIVEGDRFVVELDPGDPEVVHLHRIRATYAGALEGVYGDVDGYVDTERTAWR